MIQRRKKTAYTIILTVVILVTLVFSVVSYGWLVNYIHGDFGFSAKQLDNLKLEIARITVENPAAGAENTAPEVYDETKRTTYTECANGKIETKEDGTSHLDVSLGNMSFGAIDNVAQLKNENVVYLRLTVPKSIGNTVKLNLRYSVDDFIVLYKNVYSGDTVTGTEEVTDTNTLTKLLAVEGEAVANDSYLLYDAVVSNTECEANKIAETFESATTATNEEPKFQDGNYKKFVTDAVYQADSAAYTITVTNPDMTDDPNTTNDDNYYVYIKVVPNLAVFAYSIEYISDIMPCYMYFKISATFEALPAQESPAA